MNRLDGKNQVDRGKVWPDGFSVKPFSLLPIYLYGGLFAANEAIQLLGGQPEMVSFRNCTPLFLLGCSVIALSVGIWFWLHPVFSRSRKGSSPQKRFLILALISTLLVFHIRSLLFERVQVDGRSMEPTLQDQDSFWIRKTGVLDLSVPFNIRLRLASLSLHRGQVVVYRYPTDGRCHSPLWIKRLVGLPGDRYELKDGRILINGSPESYIAEGLPSAFNPPPTFSQPEGYQPPLTQVNPAVRKLGVEAIYAAMNGLPSSGTVPEGSVLVLGDNRSHSRDSRIVGFIPLSYLVGFADASVSE
ncbi:MAG TPA: signal peptidase I [Leptospiraceae bacterium]|nr:signal peptidase I [Leptospiraceae bacterium]